MFKNYFLNLFHHGNGNANGNYNNQEYGNGKGNDNQYVNHQYNRNNVYFDPYRVGSVKCTERFKFIISSPNDF